MFSKNNSFENQNYKKIHQSDDLAIAVSVVSAKYHKNEIRKINKRQSFLFRT